MYLSEEDIKMKLIQASQQQFKKTRRKKRNYVKNSPHLNLQYSQWSTEKQSGAFGLPLLQKAKQNQKIIMNQTNYKLAFGRKQLQKKENFSIHLPNPVNINFQSQNIKNSRRFKSKDLKYNSSEQLNLSPEEKDLKNNKLSEYLLNKQIKIFPHQLVKSQRSSGLLKLLKQRDLLRRKRYSFDIQCGFSTRTASFY